jgi:hypothetical protein
MDEGTHLDAYLASADATNLVKTYPFLGYIAVCIVGRESSHMAIFRCSVLDTV